MIQNIAEDDARGETREGWERAQVLFSTLAEDELVDPQIPVRDPAVPAVPRGRRAAVHAQAAARLLPLLR